ncbi:ABC transporter permease [Spongiactinospora sp. TRM90649]|uniref:ABC transporter permease n=1 Tax=Spongiactinospora sp. TRM90649 TaxID=3031114 RepID=UPI0023F66A0B|nr:ABC transporter permease [Spongiactinospora sp. TRM90649]MDF5755216.1 ABC transporter permease [Spongiactinospora sp. TRM90649]
MIARLIRHGVTSFFRSPVATIFTVAMPLLMMVIVGMAVGDQVTDPATGAHVMQSVVPMMTAFGVAQGCFGALAIYLARLRDRGWLKRLRGTPVPAWAVLLGLAGSVLVIALITAAVLIGAGLVFYDLQIVWRTTPALLLTLCVGTLAFTALGFALVALVRDAAAVQLTGTGLLLALAFLSDIILVGGRPPLWLDRIGWFFPLRHLAHAVRDCFNPYLTGSGFAGDHLAVIVAWGVVGALIALWRFRWEPAHARAGAVHRTRGRAPGRSPLLGQVGHTLARSRRDLSAAFFTVALPVLLLTLISLIFPGARVGGTPLPVFILAAMMTYTVGSACYVNVAEWMAADREKGVLKRLAGTPLPRWMYHVGLAVTAMVLTLVTWLALGLIAQFGYGAAIPPAAFPIMLTALVLGGACFALLGAVVATLVSRQQTAGAVTLGTFLPLAFISDVFLTGGPLPTFLQTAGDIFPLKHLSHALLASLNGRPSPWPDLTVIAAWAAAGALTLALLRRQKKRA